MCSKSTAYQNWTFTETFIQLGYVMASTRPGYRYFMDKQYIVIHSIGPIPGISMLSLYIPVYVCAKFVCLSPLPRPRLSLVVLVDSIERVWSGL